MKKYDELLEFLEERFNKNPNRHKDVSWEEILEIISKNDKILNSLEKMEETKGEPDVFKLDSGLYYIDSSKESPKDRRNLCYDLEARENRKKFPPESSVMESIKEMGIDLVDEEMYKNLQNLEDFDLKTSSWLKTDKELRKLGGAIFGDKRYKRTFIYHNGADSYYSSRGYRGFIKLK